MRRLPPDAGDLPEILSSPAATDAEGRTWLDVDAWERAREMWPEPGWDLCFTLPDEPFDADSL